LVALATAISLLFLVVFTLFDTVTFTIVTGYLDYHCCFCYLGYHAYMVFSVMFAAVVALFTVSAELTNAHRRTYIYEQACMHLFHAHRANNS
jgi:hypothetical protein